MSQDPTLDVHDTPRPNDLPTPPAEDQTMTSDPDTQMEDQISSVSTLVPQSTASTTPASTSALTPKERYDKIVSLAKRDMVVDETWYVVSQHWYRRWEKACTGVVDKEGHVEEKDIGPVDNGHIVDLKGNLIARTVTEDVDVQFLPEEAWKLLVEWYVFSGSL